VTMPVLFVVVACAAAAAGARGALIWAIVVGSIAVQAHVSTSPVVVGLIVAAAAAQVGRWGWRRFHPPAVIPHIPETLPALDLPAVPDRWWKYRPDLAIGAMVLVLAWGPPLWREIVGTGNRISLLSFFTKPHPLHG